MMMRLTWMMILSMPMRINNMIKQNRIMMFIMMTMLKTFNIMVMLNTMMMLKTKTPSHPFHRDAWLLAGRALFPSAKPIRHSGNQMNLLTARLPISCGQSQ